LLTVPLYRARDRSSIARQKVESLVTEFAQLLIGSSFLAGVAFLSWLTGLLMGYAIGRATAGGSVKHADVDQLLARERAAAGKAAGTATARVPGGPG
jgi:hypothetical protein